MKVIILLLSSLISLSADQIQGRLKIALLRVSFPEGDYPGFTGSGNFLFDANDLCSNKTIDPGPHDKNFFQSQLVAVNNYFENVSYGTFGIDTAYSTIFPKNSQDSYLIDQRMNYYNELGKENDHEKRITELLKDAVVAAYARDSIDLGSFDLVAVIHPGLGQDFDLPFLDPTPEDIPSTYVDENMVNMYFKDEIRSGNSIINKGIILPESQNIAIMDEALASAINSPCDLQFSVTGTWALMIGFAIGLPPLWELDSGASGVGIFALMDQGSNNLRGIVPSRPNPWTRIYAGWEKPTVIEESQNDIFLASNTKDQIIQLNINSSEYFLIENRSNWFRDNVGIDSSRFAYYQQKNIYPDVLEILIDSVGMKQDKNGVFTSIPNYDIGMPSSGLLIWHIDENIIKNKISSFNINEDRAMRGIDLEEADGAQDIGYISNLLTDPSSGYFGDMWFLENEEYFRSNNINSMSFTAFTYPNSNSNSNSSSNIEVLDISSTNDTMRFSVNFLNEIYRLKDLNKNIVLQYDVDKDGNLDFIGNGDSLWWSDDLKIYHTFSVGSSNTEIVVGENTTTNLITYDHSLSKNGYSIFNFDNENKNFNLSDELNLDFDFEPTFIRFIDNSDSLLFFVHDSTFLYYKGEVSYFSQYDSLQYFYQKNESQFSSILNPDDFHYLISKYETFSIGDIDQDQEAEILTIDKNGDIYAFNKNLTIVNDFPIIANASKRILIMDILDDDKPEIIYQNKYGDIIFKNNRGKTIKSFSSNVNNALRFLGSFENYLSVFLEKSIIKIKKTDESIFNSWLYENGSPTNSRVIELPEKLNVSKKNIFNEKLTYVYPNPSYGENIKFRMHLYDEANIQINIFDIAGYLAKTIYKKFEKNEILIARDQEIIFNVNDLNSGVYISHINASNANSNQKKIIKFGIIK